MVAAALQLLLDTAGALCRASVANTASSGLQVCAEKCSSVSEQETNEGHQPGCWWKTSILEWVMCPENSYVQDGQMEMATTWSLEGNASGVMP